MILEDFHIHTTFCDGDDSAEEVVLSAIEHGIKKLGFSVHAYVDFDDCCVSKEKIENYKNEIYRLRKKYKEKVKIFCGVEMDYYSNMNLDGFDYVIGSVHYVKCEDEYISVDTNPQDLQKAIKRYFNGDVYALCEEYYKRVGEIVDKFKVDIIGHFDLITKFSEREQLFNTDNIRYIEAAQTAIEKIVKRNIPFEINTGAISRGYRTTPYPSFELAEYINKLGGRFILSSDSHNKNTLCNDFEKWESEYKKRGLFVTTLDI